MNDDEIINLFLKRDENGIIELSTKYHPYCYKIAWNLLANREDAEECLNDTWFSVWSHMADVMEEMEQLNVTYTVEEQLAEKELMETINRFLEEMSPKDRNIFVRRYWFLDPVSAISKRHHMSAGSVKMNLYRNRKKLLKLLEKEGGRI